MSPVAQRWLLASIIAQIIRLMRRRRAASQQRSSSVRVSGQLKPLVRAMFAINVLDLQVIDLYANQLSGTIPTELGRLKKLQYLDLHDNNLVGRVPQEVCNLKIKEFITDCLGPKPEVDCPCCTVCCHGLPEFKCVRVATGEEVIV